MKNAVIIHGMPSEEEYVNPQTLGESHKHWIPWLQKQLILHGFLTQTPEMPKPYHPVYADWKEVFTQFQITDKSILIGHSCGAGFLLRYLSENPINIDTVALVAPWIDPTKTLPTSFFDFSIDTYLSERIRKIIIFYSTDDDKEIIESIEHIKKILPNAIYKEFDSKGHFVNESMKTNDFPELLEVLMK